MDFNSNRLNPNKHRSPNHDILPLQKSLPQILKENNHIPTTPPSPHTLFPPLDASIIHFTILPTNPRQSQPNNPKINFCGALDFLQIASSIVLNIALPLFLSLCF